VLDYAERNGCAVGAFNAPNLESLNAAVSAAEKYNVPVIISHAQSHEQYSPLDVIGGIMVLVAKNAETNVCVHLDHCEDLDYMRRALEIGFTGVMYDGSALSYEENAANTIKAVAMAKKFGAGVEAEIGQLASGEGGGKNSGGPVYTDPDTAARFAGETGIDALAPSFGTAHGIYKSKPVLDIKRVAVIKQKTGLPLVMHGGSGVSAEDYRSAIAAGIRKINYYSYMAREGVTAVKKALGGDDVIYYHELALAAEKAMQAEVEKAMEVFYGRIF
jgi:fructose-bisphosphate aldolase class II